MTEREKKHIIPKQTILTTTDMYKYYVKIINKQYEDGTLGGTWVTGVDDSTKTFYYKAEQKAHEFPSIGYAMDFVLSLACHGYSAVVETVPTWTGRMDEYLTNPKKEKEED